MGNNSELKSRLIQAIIETCPNHMKFSAFYISANWHYFSGKKILRFHKKILRFRKSKHYVSENQNITFPQIIASSVSQVIKVLPIVPYEEVEVGLRAGYYLCALKVIIKM